MSRLYPEIETLRRNSDTYKMPAPHKPSNLEKNCNQIFAKGPALTREILEKMQKAEIGPQNTNIMGYQIKTRQFWVISGLLLLFLLSSTGTAVMWFTNMFDNAVFSKLVIAKDSSSFEMWHSPSPKPLIKMHIFNYTNVKEFQNGDAEKLNVHDTGPYVYEITLERVNIHFNGSTADYQERREYKFMPELSIGRKQNDRVVVPNLPMLTAAAMNKDSNFFTRFGLSRILNGLDADPFLNLPAHRFIVGYEDNLYSLSKSVLKLQNQKPYERMGLVSSKIGVIDDIFTINTGAKDISKVATIEKFNGQTRLDHWSTSDCNSFKGATDGSMFSPKKVRNKQPVHWYLKEMCRALPMEFEKEVTILNGKIPAHRYSLPYSVFDSPDRTPSNQCFCNMDSGVCPPQGVFNATPCAFGAPAFISFPHFYNGDPSLLEGLTGLDSKHKYHQTYADLHPTLGFVMAGKTRIQFNIQVVKSFGISQLDKFKDGLMLPVAWFELSLEDKTLPADMVGIIFQTTFTIKTVEIALKCGFLLTALTTLASILIVIRSRMNKNSRNSSIKSLQRREEGAE